MKTFFALLLFCLTASAQSYTLLTLATNAVPNGATNSTAGTSIEVLRQSSVTVFGFGRAITNAGTGTVTLNFQGSGDDTNYFANSYTLTLAVNGTNTVSNFAKFDVTAFKYFKLASIENPTTNVFTNVLVYYLVK